MSDGEGQVANEGQGEGAGEGEGEGEGSTVLAGGEGAGEGEGQAAGEGEGEGQGEGEGEGEGDGAGEVPENYEFAVPEGMEMDTEFAEAITPVLKELEITQDGANKLTEVYGQMKQAEAKAAKEAYANQIDDWSGELKKDTDFGGDAFKENSSAVFKFIDKTMPDDLKEHLLGPEGLFDKTGIGQHPALVKYFFALSKAFPVTEDDPEAGGTGGPTENDQAKRMYGKTTPKAGTG